MTQRLDLLWAAPLCALLLSLGLTYVLCRHTSRWRILDRPNERSLHTSPTPRTGGIAIVAAVMFAGAVALFAAGPSNVRMAWLAVGALSVAAISLIDDRASVSPWVRLMVHVLAAAALLRDGYTLTALELPGGVLLALPMGVALAMSVLFTVWMINLYNFMDGMDGFAGGMAVAGFGTLAFLGASAGFPLYAVLNAIIAAAALGFLWFNFPPARIFMGDVGSSTLGFLAAAMMLWGMQENIISFWAALLLFSPFILDATATLIRRAVRGERVWEAHKTHYYQRMVQLGWGHRKTVLIEYVLIAGCAATVWCTRFAAPEWQWASLGAWASIYAGLAWWVSERETSTGLLSSQK